MPATSSLFEALLGDATELSEAHELVHSPGNCGTLEPRWWVVDIGVRARVLDTNAGPVSRPGPSEFREPTYFSRAPLHLRIDAGLLDGRTGSNRSWLIDATSTRAYLFASSIVISLVGPESLTPYTVGGEPSKLAGRRDLFMQVQAGIWPCDTCHQHGVPGTPARGNNCSIRVHVPPGRNDLIVPIPAGARTLAIYEARGGSSPWTWVLGETGDRVGRIAVFDGQTVDTALVPNFSHVAPATPFMGERDVLLVFGVDL